MRQFGPGTILATALVTGLIVKAAARANHMGHCYQRHGRHGPWEHQTVPDRFRPMLDRWHREAHADTEAGATESGGSRPPAAPPAAEGDAPA